MKTILSVNSRRKRGSAKGFSLNWKLQYWKWMRRRKRIFIGTRNILCIPFHQPYRPFLNWWVLANLRAPIFSSSLSRTTGRCAIHDLNVMLVGISKGLIRRIIFNGKIIGFYFLQNVWKCFWSILNAKSVIMTQNILEFYAVYKFIEKGFKNIPEKM